MHRRSSRCRGEASRATANVLCCLTGEHPWFGWRFSFLKHHNQRVVHSLTHTDSLLRRSAPLCSVTTLSLARPFISQHSTAPPTAHSNDNNPAVMRSSMCTQAHIESWTNPKITQLTIGGEMSTIGVLPRPWKYRTLPRDLFLLLVLHDCFLLTMS